MYKQKNKHNVDIVRKLKIQDKKDVMKTKRKFDGMVLKVKLFDINSDTVGANTAFPREISVPKAISKSDFASAFQVLQSNIFGNITNLCI